MGDLPSVDKGKPAGVLLYAQDDDIGTDSHPIEVHSNDPSPSTRQQDAIPLLLFGHAASGAALILIGYFAAYLVQFEALLGNWTTPYVLTVVVAVMVMVLISVRNDEGTLKFGRAFGLALLAGFLARVGYNLFNVLLFHVMRPDLQDAYVDLVVEKTAEALLLFSGIADGVENGQALLEASARFSLSLPGQALDALGSLIWLVFVALIVAAILNRNPGSDRGFNG